MSDLVAAAVGKAKEIPGWMTEPELLWLAQEASKHNTIVEVGSWLGRSTKAVAVMTPGKVFAVDFWEGGGDYGCYAPELSKVGPFGVFKKFHQNLLPEIMEGRCVPIVSKSLPASKLFKQADMVFIDADHHYACVMNDILAWLPCVRSGGILCGHDYGPLNPDVIRAVDELLPHRIVAPGTTIWRVYVG